MHVTFNRNPIAVLVALPAVALAAFLAGIALLWPAAVRDADASRKAWMREAGVNYATQMEALLQNAYSIGQMLRSLPAEKADLNSAEGSGWLRELAAKSPSLCGIWVLRASEKTLRERLQNAAMTVAAPSDIAGMHFYRSGEHDSASADPANDLFKLQNAYAALRQGGDLISQPYHDSNSGRLVLSLVLPLPAPQTGVIGIDVPIDPLFAIIRDFDRYNGYGSVIADDFLFICHSYKADLPEQSVRGNPRVREGVELLRNLKQYEYYGPSIVGNIPSFKIYTRVNLPIRGRYWSVNLILQQKGWTEHILLRDAVPRLGVGLLACLLLAAAAGILLGRRVRGQIAGYAALLDAVRVPILAADNDRRLLYMNSACARLAYTGVGTGVQAQNVIGRPCHEVIGWRLSGEAYCPLERLIRHQSRRTFFLLNNRPYEVDAGFLGPEESGPLFAMFYDRVDLMYLRPVIDASPEAVLIVDAGSFEVLEVNRNALTLYGCVNRERLIGRPLALQPSAPSAVAGGTLYAARAADKTQDAPPDRTLPEGFRPDAPDPVMGVELPAQAPSHLSKSVSRALLGGRECYVVCMLDTTAQHQTAEQLGQRNRELETLNASLQQQQQHLLHQEKMASIGQLAAGVAHEINNPVGFVASNLHTLQEYLAVFRKLYSICDGLLAAGGDKARIRELTEQLAVIARDEDIGFIIDDAAQLAAESVEGMNRVRDIVKNLKSFARADADGTGEVDINDRLRLTLRMTNNELKYKCSVIEDYGDLPPVEGNAGELTQVFMNLIVNAAAAIADKGTVAVRTRLESDGRVSISVRDTGCGIAPEHLGRIYDPFFTTKEVGKGTGLGLYLSHSIVQKHGGEIVVQSQPGEGTTFTVYLPQRIPHA